MSPTARTTRDAALPAWPVLVAVQATLLTSFVTVGVIRAPPRALQSAPPLEQQLLGLDIPSSEIAVATALSAIRSPAAVPPGDLALVTESIEQLVGQAGARVTGVAWGDAAVAAGVETLLVSVNLRADPYDVPVLLALLQRWPVQVDLIGLDAVSAGGREVSVQLDLGLSRPAAVETDWIASRLELAASGASDASPVLIQAAELSSWRVYQADLGVRRAATAQATADAYRSLSPLLVRLRREGGRLSWSPGQAASLN